MNPDDITKALEQLKIPKTHATVGVANLIACNKQYRSLFVNRRLPDYGWSDVQIQNLLFLFSTLDTNNKTLATGGGSEGENGEGDVRWCGVGEREGRVYSSLVAHRHYGLSHGMGRSGDITEPQPKAAGSSALVKLCLLLALDVVRRGSGLNGATKGNSGPAAHGILLPMCTGMSMALLLSSLRDLPNNKSKGIVLWSRIDQKSCFKAILSAGLQCVMVPTKVFEDQVITNLDAMKQALKDHENEVLAVITTTSCFAPRVPDQVDEVAKLCKEANVHHVINHAYGLQCQKTCKLINRACVVGQVDAIVCSTDKNFLVPVGGAMILSPKESIIQGVGKSYAGRASSSPIVDLFITLLSMGMKGYQKLLQDRNTLLETFSDKFQAVAKKHGERLLLTPSNTISFAITLDHLARPKNSDEEETEYLKTVEKEISKFGAMLFSRCVSGTRVVPRGQQKTMGQQEFVGFGSSVHNYPYAYMTAACAMGVSPSEIQEFLLRLDKTFSTIKNSSSSSKKQQSDNHHKQQIG